MTITTRHNPGDLVWIIFNNEPEQWKVKSIEIPIIDREYPGTPLYNLVHVGDSHVGSIHETKRLQYLVHATKRELMMSYLTDND